MNKQDHSTSLRMQKSWHEIIKQFAEQYNVSSSYVYRSAIRDFINSKIKKI